MADTSLIPILHTAHAAIAWIADTNISNCLAGRNAPFPVYSVVYLGIPRIDARLYYVMHLGD